MQAIYLNISWKKLNCSIYYNKHFFKQQDLLYSLLWDYAELEID